MEIAALIIASVLVLVGLAGSVLPLLPGVPLIFIGILIYGWATHFMLLEVGFIALALVLTILAAVIDWVAGSLGARRYGASRWGVAGALLGGLVGVVTVGPLGLILGTFIGALLGEVLAGRTTGEAVRAGWGSLLGLVGGTAVRFAIALTLTVMFFMKVF